MLLLISTARAAPQHLHRAGHRYPHCLVRAGTLVYGPFQSKKNCSAHPYARVFFPAHCRKNGHQRTHTDGFLQA